MNKLSVNYKLYAFSSFTMVCVLFEVIIPFFNPYLGTYAFWMFIINSFLLITYNIMQVNFKSDLNNTYVIRNFNFFLTLLVIVVTIFSVSFLGNKRIYYELQKQDGAFWSKIEFYWDLIILFVLNLFVLTEYSFFKLVENVRDKFGL